MRDRWTQEMLDTLERDHRPIGLFHVIVSIGALAAMLLVPASLVYGLLRYFFGG